MSYRVELNSYIAQLQKRLRLGAWLRGAAIFTGTALVVTVALVLVLNQLAFPAQGVTLSRVVILAVLAAAAVFGIALPIKRLTEAQSVRHAETANPELGHRLTTFQERASQGNNPFLELLAADTLAYAQDAEPAILVPDKHLFALGGAGLACLAVLVWIIAAGPGYLGYGASLLWAGPKKNAAPLYVLSVAPGNVTVRRNSDQLVTANITGMQPGKAQIFARYQSAAGWEPVAMQRTPGSGSNSGATFQFLFAGLPENVEYYVGAGPLVSPHYKVRVVDLPSVNEIHVTYHYPAWTGMKPVTEEHSGDLRAIEGTDATIQVETDHPLKDGQFVLDNGQTVHLSGGQNNLYQGSIHMEKDGAYHLAAIDEGQPVRLSEDYFIATDKAAPPEISIVRPGGDYRASPIEEVTIGVKGTAEFGLKDMHLHYSVNGGPDREMSLLKTPDARSADGSHTLPLEDFKLAPGDLVSLYATARDGHSEARTDISFIQIDPFEREFSQSQQSGGGAGGSGGQSGDQTEISKREKELIAATWKQQNDKTATPTSAAAQGEFLSQAQQKLRDQVNALSVRMQSRDISEANQEFTDFDRDMRDAAVAMAPSAEKLQSMQWKDAIPLEQKALQALLRAEATFRKIQVAFGQQGGGGGGGGNTGRDLASLFDLELDTAKNQYETAQSANPAQQHEKDVEDTLAKLDALAKRQEDLANRQQNPQQSFQERWEQEMLRREAEQLQRQMEQLAQNGQQNSNGSQSGQASSQRSTSSESRSGGQSGGQADSENQTSSSSPRQESGGQSSGSQSSDSSSSQSSGASSDQRIEQALSRLRQATDAMKRSGDPGSNANAQQAAEKLNQASNLLAGTQKQLASGKMDSLAREAERLRQEERAQAGQIGKFANQQDAPDVTDLNAMLARRHELTQLAQDRQKLSDSLSNLQKNLRETAREMAANQPGVAQGLRNALTEMDNSDLDNRVQRSADWLRRGIDPTANGAEDKVAQGLAQLSQQIQQAQKGMGQAKQGGKQGAGQDNAELVDQVERLRNQIESHFGAMPPSKGNNGQLGRNGQPGTDGQAGQNARGQSGRQSNFGSGQPGGNQQTRSGGNQQTRSGGNGSPSNQESGALSGEVRYGGGQSVDGTVWNNINTGNNRYGHPPQHSAATGASGNPQDAEGNDQFAMRELNQLRQMVTADPQAAKDIAELTRQMQHLDPSRFPGNPAMVEQMHREILSSLDRIELRLQREGVSSDIRTGKPDSVPVGYQESVAEYYRQLSKNP
ncbi:hypothetical protein [Acidicapsa acidisoli]|uniref:hypothetical protein n=1 Tax=Acidicapsa acidisoli TaxID=1615681 RepID=UPI0021E09D0C|nr:hypothetical protein [Acidicapsa acidisoli]